MQGITFFSIARSRKVLGTKILSFPLHSFIPLWVYFTLRHSVSSDVEFSETLAFFLMYLSVTSWTFQEVKEDTSWFQILFLSVQAIGNAEDWSLCANNHRHTGHEENEIMSVGILWFSLLIYSLIKRHGNVDLQSLYQYQVDNQQMCRRPEQACSES